MRFILLLCFSFSLTGYSFTFVRDSEDLKSFYNHSNTMLIASPGRSGSTLLTDLMEIYATPYQVLKTHMLPPDFKYQGKILFIFSNPDKAAESALHITLRDPSWGQDHFDHVRSSDSLWLQKIKGTNLQTVKDNLLSYDALGTAEQLEEWLYKMIPCRETEAQILAIKYEELWDPRITEEIKRFLSLESFALPEKKKRGAQILTIKERDFRQRYNLGSAFAPKYRAYDRARILWEQAPAIQYLKLPEL